jgi:HEAT repeat protein
MRNLVNQRSKSLCCLLGIVLLVSISAPGNIAVVSEAQSDKALTPAQLEIEKQRQRLNSPDEEERRDGLMHLGAMHLQAASRVALTSLADPSPVVRAVAAHAILALESEESSRVLIPLLNDKDEFVRREAVDALGLTHSRSAVAALSERLVSDKKDSVRGAAAVALGEIADESAVVALAEVLSQQLPSQPKGKPKLKAEQNPFVLRASATALGRIRSRAGVPALLGALANEKLPDDVRREAANALGLIGDPVAVPALRAASTAADPHLARTAFESLRKITP